MKTSSVPDYPRGVTFEQVWATLQENAKQMEKNERKRDKEWEKSRREWEERQEKSKREWEERQKKYEQEQEKSKREREEQDKKYKLEWEKSKREREKSKQEWDKEWEKSNREWNKRFGDLSNRFGELAEHLVAPGINERFNELGYHFDEEATGGVKIKENGKTKAEIDLLLQNDNTVMAVEVKSKPDEDDITDHIKRIEILRDHRRRKNDMRQVEGAIAGAIFPAAAKRAAIKAGLYVIEQTGDTMKIDVPEGFVPRKW